MRRLVCLLLMVFLLAGFLPAQSPTDASADLPKTEYPLWARDLRRAEIIAFGALPFTIFLATFIVDSYRWSTNGWDTRYAPWPIKSAGAVVMNMDQRLICFSAGIAGAAAVAIADHIIIRVKRYKAEKEIRSMPSGDPVLIIRHAGEPEEEIPEDEADENGAVIPGEPIFKDE